VPFMSRFKLIYALFINVENETALYWQWFVIQWCPLRQVWFVPFKASLIRTL
jgi:hypothetical protein